MSPIGAVIEAFARHRVAPYLLMLLAFIACGWALAKLNTRFFPRFELQLIVVSVAWPGASAEEIEESIVVPLENKLRDTPDIKKLTAVASEGAATFYLEFPDKIDLVEVEEEAKTLVDQVAGDLPEESETPRVRKINVYDDIARVSILGGDMAELRRLARRFESELLRLGVARVEVLGLPEEEIRVEIDRRQLVEMNATLREIGVRVREQNRDLSAGEVGGAAAERQLRALAKREDQLGLREIAVASDAAGRVVRLGDIAQIRRASADGQLAIIHNGQPAVQLKVQRGDNDDTLKAARVLNEWVEKTRATLPPNIELAVHGEDWKYVDSRLELLLRNGAQGLVLVLAILFLFLSARVAFWVGISIPVIFATALYVLHLAGGSINMISMFALIMATGIVVDDSIVVAENGAHLLQKGASPLRASVDGARQMFTPIFASTFTTIASFLPLFLIGGVVGGIIYDIPLVIVSILIAAILECFLVLPGHLYHSFSGMRRAGEGRLRRFLDGVFFAFQEGLFRRAATLAVRYRSATICACVSLLILSLGLFAGGLVKFRFFPGAELNLVFVDSIFAVGTPRAQVEKFTARLQETLREAEARFPDEKNLVRHVSVFSGQGVIESRGRIAEDDHLGGILVELSQAGERSILVDDFIREWRTLIEIPPGVDTFAMRGAEGGPPGAEIEALLSGADIDAVKQASLRLQDALKNIVGLSEVRDDTPYGKEQLIVELTPRGRALGLSVSEIGAQLRDSFDGYLAQTFYEGVDEVELRVMLSESQRREVAALGGFQIILPGGGHVALSDVAKIRGRRGLETISRVDGRPAINVTAELDFAANTAENVIESLTTGVLTELQSAGIDYSFEGKRADERETVRDMITGLILAVAGIYLILTAVFASWSLPIVIMLTMPLGVVGAIFGHFVMGKEMSILSFFGVFTLMGIIVNDSIVMVRYYQDNLAQDPAADRDRLIIDAACRRLRAILVTSLTTIGGLTPLMFETSQQAQFLIPMAVSICFGLAFATFLLLFFTPACLSMRESIVRVFSPRPRLASAAA